MKNMSFGKMLGLFGGFLLLMIVCAFVIVKMNASGKAQTKQVTTKRYKPQDDGAAQARDSAQRAQEAAVAAAQPPAPQAGNPALLAAQPVPGQTQPAVLVQPGQAVLASRQNAVVIPATPGAINDVNQNQNIANVSAAVINLDARVALLEGNRGNPGAAPAAARKPALRRVRKAPAKVLVVRAPTPLTEMRGYKAMAVVGGRAWVSAPDGTEDSVLVGDPVPRARVRSMSKETGAVVTTNDQYIDPVR